jgi:hypothetical protein
MIEMTTLISSAVVKKEIRFWKEDFMCTPVTMRLV